jgi:hypothetical protein
LEAAVEANDLAWRRRVAEVRAEWQDVKTTKGYDAGWRDACDAIEAGLQTGGPRPPARNEAPGDRASGLTPPSGRGRIEEPDDAVEAGLGEWERES